MARNSNSSNNNNNNSPKPDAYLNVFVIDKNGVERRLGSRGISLFETNRMDRSVINHINALPEGQEHKLNVVTKLVMVTDDSGEDDFAL